MTATSRVVRDTETLIASIRQDWPELAAKALSRGERQHLRKQIVVCIMELTRLQIIASPPANA